MSITTSQLAPSNKSMSIRAWPWLVGTIFATDAARLGCTVRGLLYL